MESARAGSRRRRFVLAAVGVALLCGACLAPAVLAKSKSVEKTKSTTVSLAPGSATAANANCPSGYHASGGGYQVTPSFNPPALSGVRSVGTSSIPAGLRAWRGGASAFQASAAGSLKAYAQCEKNSEGTIVQIPIGSGTVILGTSLNVAVNCTSGSHVISGGFTASAPPNLADPDQIGVQVLQSRRTATNQWTVTVVDPLPPAGVLSGSLTASALCEKNKNQQNKKVKVSEVSSTVPIAENARTSADATCSKKKHLVSGGFLASPTTGGTAPGVSFDEVQPSGSRTWHVGLYDSPKYNLPAGSSLTTYAYCKKGK